MDRWDLSFKFSTEILIIGLAVLVAGLNFYFFHASSLNDNSQAAKFLTYHYSLNPKLYYKNSITRTVVAKSALVAQAQADNYVGLNPDQQNQELTDSGYSASNQVLGQALPDSLDSLIAKQVKVYTTQPGDTLGSVASRFGISGQTIVWANNLPSNTIKPGWQLLILPTNGILVKANDNDTLPDLAAKYNSQRYNTNKTAKDNAANALLEKIISYNALGSAEDIQGGQYIIIPGGVVATPPTPQKPSRNNSGKIGGSGKIENVEGGSDRGGHLFPKGYCTWYVAQKLGGKVTWGGNAKSWPTNARAAGATVTSVPMPGAIVVTNDSARYGHVAYVESVSGGNIVITEMNYDKFGKVDRRTIPIGSSSIKAYIYP